MFNVDQFVQECLQASRESFNPVGDIAAIMRTALNDRTDLLESFPARGEEEILLHNSKDLTVYRVLVYHGLQYPPHEHGMPVVIGMYQGCETNYLYKRSQRDPGVLVEGSRVDLKASQVQIFDGNAIHSIANLLAQPSAAIHVYLGDLHAQKRSMWSLDLDSERQFDLEYYFRWARSLGTPIQSVA